MNRFAFALFASLLPFSTQAAAQDLVVTADRMLDVERGRYVDNPVLVIRDGRVVSWDGSGGNGIEDRLEYPGGTILPGLIDMHVHLTGVADIGGWRGLEYTDSFWTVMAAPNAEKTLRAGFTTVRNVGSENFADVGLMQAIEDGRVAGPRVVPAGYAIGATGGHCDNNLYGPEMNATSPGVADGPEEMRERVRWMRKYGAGVIKICATGGVFSKGTTVGEQQLTVEEIRAAVDAARLLGLKVAAHAHGTDGIKAAILGGVDTVEHASYLDDEAIEMAKAHGTAFSMDIYNTEYTLSEGEKNGVREENLAKERQVSQVQRDSFRRAVEAGATMVFGSDAAIFPHGDNARQFRVMVEYGMTPLQAIRAATVTAADKLGHAGAVGTLKPGAFGDLIVVSGDPLADVTVLERPVAVVKGGNPVRLLPVSTD